VANSQQDNNDTYRLHSARGQGAVVVVNQDGYVMAEYDQRTGATAWLRVVAATKRDSVEQRLAQQYPPIVRKIAGAKPLSNKRTIELSS
jgi:hypothetical protein